MTDEDNTMNDEHDKPDALMDMLITSARWLLQAARPQDYVERMALHGPMRFAAMTAGPAPPDMPDEEKAVHHSRLFRIFGWAIAGAAPMPAQHWQPRKLPLPGRNEPCLCGSLRKFKHCCSDLMHTVPEFDSDMIGALLIAAMPADEQAALHANRAPMRLVLGAAEWMRDDDSPGAREAGAARLLEPYSKLPPPWPDERAELLDWLGDLYLDLNKPRKRKQLALDMVAHGGPAVQAKGWQRLSLLATDRGDAAEARNAFQNAQRLQPNDPNLALLEVTTLMGTGEMEQARQRAAFHARRLARLPEADELADAIASLEELSKADSDLSQLALRQLTGNDEIADIFTQIHDWVEGLPPPKLRLTLPKEQVSDLEELKPNATAKKALVRWRQSFGASQHRMAWQQSSADDLFLLERADWLLLLQSDPALGDCFEVLDGLISLLDHVPAHLMASAQSALLGRALELWELLRKRQPRAACEWAWMGNRAALRALAMRCDLDQTPLADSSFTELRHLVEVLNPHDNHGLRERLVAVYLRHGQLDAAAALCAKYEDDGIGMTLLQARTALARQDLGAAAGLLATALADNKHLRKLLETSRAPKSPQVPSYAVGSVEHARIALAGQWDLWRHDPAVRLWLQQQLHPGQATELPGLFDNTPHRAP